MAKRKFDVWQEGFMLTGMDSPATAVLIAEDIEGDDFLDACNKYFKDDSLYSVRDGIPCIWGCRLYPTEQEARRFLG